ncbi:MAG: NAD(P)/FAD-dependent oxidoreductase [Gammaproteobacteria bacterium]
MTDTNLAQRFIPLSAYLDPPADLQPPLREDLRASVAVIGGGWTGLHAAIALRLAGADVVLLEQRHCGYGASGRSGGHLVGPGKEFRRLLAEPGSDTARRYGRYITDIVDEAESLLHDYGIDCDYVPSGNLFGATHPSMLTEAQALAAAAGPAGFHAEFWDERQCRARGIPAAWIGGAYLPRGGTLHPGKYVLGLRAVALAKGVRLFENTTVARIEDGAPAVVRAAEGAVTADTVVLATNAFTPTTLNLHKTAMAAFHIGAFETRPLATVDLETLGWPQREGLVSLHNVIEAYRVTRHATIVANTKRIQVAYANALPTSYAPAIFEPMVQGFRDRFPGLRHLEIASLWAGWCGLTSDMLPRIGTSGRHRNVHYGFGFNGHGVAPTAAMGRALAALAQGRRHPALEFLERKAANWPPEPLRWLGANLFLWSLQRKDDRIDRALRTG